MPQTFQVLRCYKCSVFQIHQTKKSNKFVCKLCGEKQSIKRHYGLGTGKECRLHVQKLNLIRGNMDDSKNSLSTDDDDIDDIQNRDQDEEQDLFKTEKESKWSEYIDKTEEDTNEYVKDMYLDNTEVVLEIPSKRRKFTRNKNRASNKFKRNDEELDRDSIIECNSNNISNVALQTGKASTSKKTERKKFVPPACNKMSKWANFVDENNGNEGFHSDEELEKSYVDSKQFPKKPPNNEEMCNAQRNMTVNRSDRMKILCQSNPIKIIKNTSNNQTQNLFSLCNDNDLDKILDI